MRPLPIRYVRDVETAERFYTALGLAPSFRSRRTRTGVRQWTELAGQGGLLALHALSEDEAARTPPVELAFETDEPLEQVVARLREAGFTPETAIVDEAFGRSVRVRDPEGLVVQVNEHDRDLQA